MKKLIIPALLALLVGCNGLAITEDPTECLEVAGEAPCCEPPDLEHEGCPGEHQELGVTSDAFRCLIDDANYGPFVEYAGAGDVTAYGRKGSISVFRTECGGDGRIVMETFARTDEALCATTCYSDDLCGDIPLCSWAEGVECCNMAGQGAVCPCPFERYPDDPGQVTL